MNFFFPPTLFCCCCLPLPPGMCVFVIVAEISTSPAEETKGKRKWSLKILIFFWYESIEA